MKRPFPRTPRHPLSAGRLPHLPAASSLRIASTCVACFFLSYGVKIPTRVVFTAQHTESSLSQELFQRVNSYRSSRGAAPLTRHSGLDRLAQDHCEYLRQHRGTFSLYGKNVSHLGFETRARIASLYYHMDACSENVAFTMSRPTETQTVTALVSLWQHSENHEYAMSQKTWTDTGIGIVVDRDGAVFATQIFGIGHNALLVEQTRQEP